MSLELSTAAIRDNDMGSTQRPSPSASTRRWTLTLTGVLVTSVAAASLWFFHTPLLALFEPPPPKGAPQQVEAVTLDASGFMSVSLDSSLAKRLQIVPVAKEKIEYPLLNVTGYVMARLAPGLDRAESRWDFAGPDVATAYGDWLNARKDVEFLERQAVSTRELTTVKVAAAKTEYDRKAKYPNAIPEGDLFRAKSDWVQADIQSKKDNYEAESALQKAIRNRGLLERQLLQSGIDPEVVREAADGLVLVVADVPEAKIGLVKVGQTCEGTFFAMPGAVFKGRVGRLGPSVSKEKRTLRVTFELASPSAPLLPGMFAEIGLGTESRSEWTVPAEAVLHSGHADYIMREESAGKFRAIEVKVGEPFQAARASPASAARSLRIPVREGLNDNDRILSSGAILLKPMLLKSLAPTQGMMSR
jgi:hypothetical protein